MPFSLKVYKKCLPIQILGTFYAIFRYCKMDAHLELESLGILRQTKTPENLKWMNDDDKRFMLELLHAGEEGMHKRDVAKFDKEHPEATLRLTVNNLAQWERDKNGRIMFLVLTWQGQDAAELLRKIAQHQSKNVSYVRA